MLHASPGLRPIAKFEEVVRRHPELGTGVRRTLERRILTWRAVNGPEQDVIFRQTHKGMLTSQTHWTGRHATHPAVICSSNR